MSLGVAGFRLPIANLRDLFFLLCGLVSSAVIPKMLNFDRYQWAIKKVPSRQGELKCT